MKVNWFEFKYLDKSTNHSTQTETIEYFKSQGVDIRYHCSYKKEKKYFGLSADVINYISVPKVRYIRGLLILLIIFLRSLYSYVCHKDAKQVIDYVCIYPCLPILILNKLFKRNSFVLDIRTYPVGSVYQKLPWNFTVSYKIACLLCDGVSFITKVMENDAKNWGGKLPRKTTCWGSGYNPKLFQPTTQVINKSEPFNLIYHGGISESRGVLDLIKAVELCKKQGLNVHLTLIGVWVDKDKLQRYVCDNELDDAVSCFDPVPLKNIPAIVAKSDMGILPFPDFIGWRVSSPIKLFEYLGAGKPVIVTDIDCFSQEVGEKPYVIYAKDSQPASLAKAIQLAEKNKISYLQHSQEASELALKHYTWHAQAEKLLSFLRKL